MNRAFYIVGIVFAVIFLFLGAYYAEEVSSARWNDYFSSYSSFDYSYSFGSDLDNEYTEEAGLWSLFFILSFITVDLLGLLKVKTKTVKVLSIIGLSLSLIMLIWTFLMISSPGSISFDEVYPAWAFYCLTVLAFSIVGLVQSVRYYRRSRMGYITPNSDSKDLLDS